MDSFTPGEIAHALKRGYCLGCDRQSGPHAWRRWTPGEGHAVEQHPGVGEIGEDGLCAPCRKSRKQS